jgi:hypothetical protein
MSTDVGKVTEGVFFLHIGLTAPLTVVVIIVLLWIEVGWAAVGCIVVTAVLLPTQGKRGARPSVRRTPAHASGARRVVKMATLIGRNRRKMLVHAHERVKVNAGARRECAALRALRPAGCVRSCSPRSGAASVWSSCTVRVHGHGWAGLGWADRERWHSVGAAVRRAGRVRARQGADLAALVKHFRLAGHRRGLSVAHRRSVAAARGTLHHDVQCGPRSRCAGGSTAPLAIFALLPLTGTEISTAMVFKVVRFSQPAFCPAAAPLPAHPAPCARSSRS